MRFTFYGANRPQNIEDVHARRVDVSILNPAAMLTMAQRGTGAFTSPRDVATIAVLPHDDRLAFAVASGLGFKSLENIAAAKYPLRVSVRGSIDACTPVMVDVVLRQHGFSLDDIVAWGGEISYDQPMPNDPARLGRVERGELDAIFDEGVVMWADRVTAGGRSSATRTRPTYWSGRSARRWSAAATLSRGTSAASASRRYRSSAWSGTRPIPR